VLRLVGTSSSPTSPLATTSTFGRFSQGGTNNTGLGIWGNEFTIGSTIYLDQKKTWNAAASFGLEFHTDKSGTNIKVGDLGTVEGGLGKTF
jgi:hypothetical protein